MNITFKLEATVVYITIDGDLTFKNGDRLDKVLHEITLLDNVNHVVFNMEKVNSLTAGGIGKLLNFYNHMLSKHGRMEIKGVSENLYNQFLDTHLDRIIPVSRLEKKQKEMRIKIQKDSPALYFTIYGDFEFENEEHIEKLNAAFSVIASIEDINHVVLNISTVIADLTPIFIAKIVTFYGLMRKKNKTMEIRGISDQLYFQCLCMHIDGIFPISRKKKRKNEDRCKKGFCDFFSHN